MSNNKDKQGKQNKKTTSAEEAKKVRRPTLPFGHNIISNPTQARRSAWSQRELGEK